MRAARVRGLLAAATVIGCGAPVNEKTPPVKDEAPQADTRPTEVPPVKEAPETDTRPTEAPPTTTPPEAGPVATPEPTPMKPPEAGTPTASVPDNKGAPTIAIEKTAFRITLPDGHVLSAQELVGVVLTVRDEANAWRKVRIEKVEADPRDPEITLYDASVQDPKTKAWAPLCNPGPDGLARAMALAGAWTADGAHEPTAGAFNMTCTSGAIGKCVRFGYKPWATGKDGSSLWDYHQSCVRMLRGDYCGDGHAFTKNGMLVNVGDRLDIQRPADHPDMAFEAAWGPAGALCVHHVRVPENATLAALEARCPERLRGRTGSACTLAGFTGDPQFRLYEHSYDPPK